MVMKCLDVGDRIHEADQQIIVFRYRIVGLAS